MTGNLKIMCQTHGEISAVKCAAKRAQGGVDCLGCEQWKRFAEESRERVEKDPFAGCEFQAFKAAHTRIGDPRISVYARGDIGINKPGIEAMGRDCKYIKPFYDKTARVLALKPLREPEHGAYSVSSAGTTCVKINSAKFVRDMEIPMAKNVQITWSPTHGMWCARLPGAQQ